VRVDVERGRDLPLPDAVADLKRGDSLIEEVRAQALGRFPPQLRDAARLEDAELTSALLRKFCIRQASYVLDQAKGNVAHASLVVSRTTNRASLELLDVLHR
jgi:hypothetical protein